MQSDEPPSNGAVDRRPSTADPRTPNHDRSGKRSFLVTLARYGELAFVMPACTVAGWLVGVALDHWLRQDWLYLVGLVAGIIAGFVQLARTVASSE